MKRFFQLLFPLLLISGVFASAQTPEVKARNKIAPLRGVKINNWPNYGITDALTAITDFSAKKIPFLTAAELRAGEADAASAVLITDPSIRGVFYHVPGSSAADDGVKVIVAAGKRFVKDTTEMHSIALVSNQVATLNSTVTAQQTAIGLKANSTDVAASLASKANASSLAGKADAAAVASSLALKADVTAVNAKADVTAVNAALDLKANVSTVNAAMAQKVDVSSMSAYMQLSAANTIAGSNIYSATQNYRSTWSAGQALFGTGGNAGRVLFARSSDGAGQAWIGYKSASNSADLSINSPAGTGTVDVTTAAGTAFKVFSDGRSVFKKGGTMVNAGTHDVTVDGTAKITGNLEASSLVTLSASVKLDTANIKEFTTNDAATDALGVGFIYKHKEPDGRFSINLTHLATRQPIFTQAIANLATRTIFAGTTSDAQYKAQRDPLADWAVTQTATGTPPVFRFEVRPGDVWPTDTVNGNDQNGNWKERSELYHVNKTTKLGFNTPWESVQWISYRMYVEPGGDVVYTDVNGNHYTDLGQWHAKTGEGQATIKIDFSGQTLFRFYTHGGTVAGSGTKVAEMNLARGQWHNIVMRIKHSTNPTGGEFRLYVNSATPIVNLTGIPLGIRGESDAGYWKFGIYRTAADDGTSGGEIDRRVILAVKYANMEISTVDLSGRITSPLPVVE